MRVVIVGGGGFRVPLLHRALVASALPVEELVLHDTDAAALAVIGSVLAGSARGGPPVRATTDLDTALAGADLVFSAIRVGGTDGRIRDEREALARGLIGQETVGAGGISYAIRCVPQVRALADAVARNAPDAWVISMTNPAGVVVEAMRPRLGDRVIGVCDSPVGLIRRAAVAAGADPATAEADYVGLNHLGWLRSLRSNGRDVLPALLADATAVESFEEGRLFGAPLLHALGSLPNEYLYYFYCAREALAALRAAGHTRGELVRARQHEFYAAASRDPARAAQLWAIANDERNATYFAELRPAGAEREQADISDGGYETVALALADALTGGPPRRLILDVANGTALPQLDPDAVIETVCRVDAEGAVPLPLAPLTGHQLGLMASVKAAERAAIEAATTGSPSAALRAFALHPLVGSSVAARELALLALRHAAVER